MSAQREQSDFVRMLNHFGINLILDVGAYHGESAEKLFWQGYRGRIISFEPLSSHFEKLQSRSKCGRENGWSWKAFPIALGDEDDEAEINVSLNGQSSSLSEMLPTHVALNNESRYVAKEKITVRRLDSIYDDLVPSGSQVLLMLDVQGLELQVLAGAAHSLARIAGVQMEVSLRPVYATGPSVPEAFQKMADLGFTPCYVEPAWKDTESCVFYQVDFLWFRLNEAAT